MLIFLTTLLASLASIFRSRASLGLENLALRHQIGVLHSSPGKRPKLTASELRDLIRKMCRENPGWGAPRIHGELLKLGIDIGESSVSKYMVRCRKPPSQTWLSIQLRPRRRKRNLYPVSHSVHSLRPRLRSEYRSRADRGV